MMRRNHWLSHLFSLSATIMTTTMTIIVIHVHGFAPLSSSSINTKTSHRRDLRNKHTTTSLPYHTSADPEAITIIPDVFLGCNFHLNSNNGLKQLESIILPTTTDANAFPSSFSNNNNNNNYKPKTTISTKTKVRFHFVRHGESLANKSNKIAGQMDVPLTSHGLEEAKLLGQASPWLLKTNNNQNKNTDNDNDSDSDGSSSSSSFNWWRIYSSDLSRAKNTALMALQQQQNNEFLPPPPIIEDQRLRERSYGIRQGFPRSMSKNEILASRQEQGLTELPPYETNKQIWQRAKEWMLDALHEVKQVQILEQQLLLSSSCYYYPSDVVEDSKNNKKVYNIFVSAHAGLIREILMNLISNKDLVELGGKFDYSTNNNGNNKLIIPNTSMSIIEMDPFYDDDDEPIQQNNVNVIDLLNSDHLHKVNIYDD